MYPHIHFRSYVFYAGVYLTFRWGSTDVWRKKRKVEFFIKRRKRRHKGNIKVKKGYDKWNGKKRQKE
jgi:hypothetical protein